MIDPLRVQQYSDKILEIVEHEDDFSRSDFQGAIEAVVMNIIMDIEGKKK
jgi:hypothetical protein